MYVPSYEVGRSLSKSHRKESEHMERVLDAVFGYYICLYANYKSCKHIVCNVISYYRLEKICKEERIVIIKNRFI